MIRAIIFDFDGLILDTESAEYQSWQEVYRQHGYDLPHERWVKGIGCSGGFDPYNCLAEFVGDNIDREAIRLVRKARTNALLLESSVQPGIVEYLDAAKLMGLQVGIASGSHLSWILPHLQRLGLAASFPHICCADHVQRVKPNPDVYLAMLAQLNLTPPQAIALEDSPNGVAAAVAAGIYCVAVPNPVTRSLNFAAANLRIESLSALPLTAVVRLAEEQDAGKQWKEKSDDITTL